VVVYDTTKCVDPQTTGDALLALVGDAPLHVEVSVLPEGTKRAIHITWQGVGERSLEIAAVDCGDGVAQLISLTTERALAALPGGLEALSGPSWRGAVGTASALGWPVAPRIDLWAQATRGDRLAGVLAAELGVGSQFVGSGAVRSVGGLGFLGVSYPMGAPRAVVLLGAGGLVGRGVGLAQVQSGVSPRLVARTGVDLWQGRWLFGAHLELPLILVVWTAEGVGQQAEPALRLHGQVGIRLGQ
jgi:hypothetical protein